MEERTHEVADDPLRLPASPQPVKCPVVIQRKFYRPHSEVVGGYLETLKQCLFEHSCKKKQSCWMKK